MYHNPNQPKKPSIVMIPCPLVEEDTHNQTLSPDVFNYTQKLNHFIVENEKTARRFIKKINPEKKQSELVISILDKRTTAEEIQTFFEPIKNGYSVGVISEAGCPGIADPGAQIVKIAHQKNINVIPLVGPSSILLAIIGSGFNGQNFSFVGYLPIDKIERIKKIKELEELCYKKKQTQIFIETPYRNNVMMQSLLATLYPKTKVCVASNITAANQYIKTLSVKDWGKNKYDFHKKPTVFLIGL